MLESITSSVRPARAGVPTGARRLSLQMLAQLDRADGFEGLPKGTAKPLRFMAAFQEAEPYLGLPTHAYKLIAWLVKQTQNQDWEEGSRPIAWPSARRQAEFLALSPTRVKALNRTLFEAGVFVLRDDPQGKRYGRRGFDGKIIEAYGFDLSPLALRYDEFVRLAASARIEREHMRALRRRVTFARRRIRQVGEELTALDRLPSSWTQLEATTADLIAAARQQERSEELAVIVGSLERRKAEAEGLLRSCQEPVNHNPKGSENGPHTTTTNLTIYLKEDTVIASEESSSTAALTPKPSPTVPTETPERVSRLKPGQLLDLAPRLAGYVLSHTPDWRDLVDAAAMGLRPELGVSPSLWGEACRIMGRETAALALAIVSTKPAAHFTRGAGGYFAGMVRRAEAGELHLERTLWALREAKWGKVDKRRPN